MKKLRSIWFSFGFVSCLFLLAAVIAYNIFYIDSSYQVDLHTYSISLPSGELMVYTHDVCTETNESSGAHVLTLLNSNGTWESKVLDSSFSQFKKFILATSENKEIIWAIDPIQNNWIEWNTVSNEISEHNNEIPPEYTKINRYVKIDKT